MGSLPEAPPTPWDERGSPAFGTYVGECVDAPFDEWFRPVARVRSQKRWVWFGALCDDVAVGAAIVRTGYAANVFCWVFDRGDRTFREDVARVLPRVAVKVADTPGDGVVASYRALVEGFAIVRADTTWTIEGSIGDTRIDLTLREGARPVTAICPVATHRENHLNVTRKQAIATVTGYLRAASRRFELTDASGFLDHSHGMLPAETVWQWAIGSGRLDDGSPAAFNLVASFNDGLENVVWRHATPRHAGPVEFEIPREPGERWRVIGEGLELELEPEGVRAQELDLGLVASDYSQPIGTWRGEIDGRPFEGVGVAENHRSVW